ncbi:hypothetical protein NIES4075_13870 [Tolypothrix sp. NIES-4075]|nr:hypothetical protein NIES4075_13870 [Tolypothrix sp. NIES-4075]
MKQIIKKALTLVSVYYAYMVEYRAELILWVLARSLPIILMGVWIQAVRNRKFGLTAVDFARYFLAVFFVRQFFIQQKYFIFSINKLRSATTKASWSGLETF